ncbi:MAG: ATP-binding cassette domain-containing protein, partial [Clostridium sp.]
MEKILDIKDLKVSFHTYAGEVQAVRGISFHLNKGETLAVVGESGCGKTVTAKAIMRLLPEPMPAE